MSNPHYSHDLEALEGDGEWDITRVLTPATVLIVVATHPFAELLDRPPAEELRDAIDQRGDVPSGRRGLLITDLWWHQADDVHLEYSPTIFVGGSREYCELSIIEELWREDGIHYVVYDFLSAPCIGLWGSNASLTAAATRRFTIERLPEFLARCWPGEAVGY